MSSNLSLVISREYCERVTKKSFILTTILTPLIMVALMAAPALIMNLNTSETKNIAVVDRSGVIAPQLEDSETVHYIVTKGESIDSLTANKAYDGVLEIGANMVSRPDDGRLYTRDAASLEMVGEMRHQLSRIIEGQRIEAYNISDLRDIIKEVQVDVNLSTSRVADNNEASDTSSTVSTAIGFGMTFVLYMFLIMYGQMVMTSIIEEKNNRVLEIVVSSVKPTQLMMGKIIGVGLVAVTQVIIWAVLIAVLSATLVPVLMPADVMADVAAYNAGSFNAATATSDADLVAAISQLSDMGFIVEVFGFSLLFLIGGFLFYAAINAAIGSSVDNIQDAGQLQVFCVVPIIIGLVFAMGTVTDPNSSLALWSSFIPLTSPMVMMARIPFGIPAWQIWLSLVVLYASFVGMVWVAAKIYRVGIFMYGKKPSVKELIRWITYK